ncbi:hypothetical protein [Cognatilysobacter segetis]|uniref:hypothetical protein n=1 Tax=Cognatilysobacter segetis TaxID=2492394 RepID=UPI0010614C56|nr:hypothetical protein [Lysobacter segetis]
MDRRPLDDTERTATASGHESDRERRTRAEAERTRLRSAAGRDTETGRDSARSADETRQGT